MQSPFFSIRKKILMPANPPFQFKGRLLLLFLFFLLFSDNASAHFYYDRHFPFAGTTPDLSKMLPDSTGKSAFWSIKNKAYFVSLKQKLLAEGHPENDFRFQADLAFCNYILGDTSAVTTLENLYVNHPEESNLAANLSLIYEQKGDKEKALQLAERAYALFPGAWFGSGQMRISLLEGNNKALSLNGDTPFDQWLNDPKKTTAANTDTLMLQLAWQLHLRTAIFSAPDSLTAQLLIVFADLVAKTNTRSTAKPFYEAALQYDLERKTFITERLALMDASEKEVKKTFRWAALVWGVPILALLIAFTGNIINRRKKQAGISSSNASQGPGNGTHLP
ncbi:MAG: tetratricopeptide repeat protein [Chitinophagaceae bacterium]